jgi:general stress protein 26
LKERAKLIRDKTQFQKHWTEGFDRWFKQGVDTGGLVLIEVHADKLHYWDGENEGEVDLRVRA